MPWWLAQKPPQPKTRPVLTRQQQYNFTRFWLFFKLVLKLSVLSGDINVLSQLYLYCQSLFQLNIHPIIVYSFCKLRSLFMYFHYEYTCTGPPNQTKLIVDTLPMYMSLIPQSIVCCLVRLICIYIYTFLSFMS